MTYDQIKIKKLESALRSSEERAQKAEYLSEKYYQAMHSLKARCEQAEKERDEYRDKCLHDPEGM